MRLAALVLLAGCGRFGFDAHASDALTTGDTHAPDTTTSDSAIEPFYSDGFEGTTISPLWMLDVQNGTAMLDSTHVHGGSSALRVTIDVGVNGATNPRATLVRYDGLPITGTLFARAWMYFASPIPPQPFLQVINFADNPGMGISMGERNGVVANNDYTAGNYAESATALPLDTWTCVRYQIASGTTDTSRVHLDANELVDIALAKASPQPPPTHLYLGIEWVGTVSSQAVAAWIDDFAVGSAAIPCN